MAGNLIRPAENDWRTHDSRHADHHIRRRQRREADQTAALGVGGFLGAVIALDVVIDSGLLLMRMYDAIGMPMHRAITLRMRVRLDLHRLNTVVIGLRQAMRGVCSVTESKSGSRRENAQRIEHGEQPRHAPPCDPGQPDKHRLGHQIEPGLCPVHAATWWPAQVPSTQRQPMGAAQLTL